VHRSDLYEFQGVLEDEGQKGVSAAAFDPLAEPGQPLDGRLVRAEDGVLGGELTGLGEQGPP